MDKHAEYHSNYQPDFGEQSITIIWRVYAFQLYDFDFQTCSSDPNV